MPRPAPAPAWSPNGRRKPPGSCGRAPGRHSGPSADLDGRRPALVGLHDATEDGTAYRTELSPRVEEPVLSSAPILHQDLDLPQTWWAQLAETLEKLAAAATDRVTVRTHYMQRTIPQFVGIPAPKAPC
ncbi:hypothetical protein [Streptomyces chartreusis]|uniref:hypothetical protein n=1 Tax=Streptomyces chartreusis TaxID=1969 RepID=UPI00378B57E0